MSIMITCFVESNRKYMYNYIINVFWKIIGQTLSQSIQNIFPPNIYQCLQCFKGDSPEALMTLGSWVGAFDFPPPNLYILLKQSSTRLSFRMLFYNGFITYPDS